MRNHPHHKHHFVFKYTREEIKCCHSDILVKSFSELKIEHKKTDESSNSVSGSSFGSFPVVLNLNKMDVECDGQIKNKKRKKNMSNPCINNIYDNVKACY